MRTNFRTFCSRVDLCLYIFQKSTVLSLGGLFRLQRLGPVSIQPVFLDLFVLLYTCLKYVFTALTNYN